MQKIKISSGSPLESPIGFSRAIRNGNYIAIAGTAAINPDGTTACLGDLYGQTKFCLEIIKRAIADAGGSLEDIVRTRIILTDISRWKEAAKAHGEYFSNIRPACTFMEVNRFISEEW